MNITSAKFVKGIVGPDEILEDGVPQVAFIGRSNVGKSSLINTLAEQKNLARTSSFPGRTQEINFFCINKSLYLVDLPGYGFAKGSREIQENIQQLIYWYLFTSQIHQKKVVLIIDANIGFTENDLQMLHSLREHEKDIILAANKVDKLKKSEYKQKLQQVRKIAGNMPVVEYSSEKKIGISELRKEIYSK